MLFVTLVPNGGLEVCLPVALIAAVAEGGTGSHTPSVTVTMTTGTAYTRTEGTGGTPYDDFKRKLTALGVAIG